MICVMSDTPGEGEGRLSSGSRRSPALRGRTPLPELAHEQLRSTREILERVWPEGSLASSTDVKRYIHLLRRKVEEDPKQPKLILTVKGFGYKLAA